MNVVGCKGGTPAMWTSECTFQTYLRMKDSPAVDVMYDDMIKEIGGALAVWRSSQGSAHADSSLNPDLVQNS